MLICVLRRLFCHVNNYSLLSIQPRNVIYIFKAPRTNQTTKKTIQYSFFVGKWTIMFGPQIFLILSDSLYLSIWARWYFFFFENSIEANTMNSKPTSDAHFKRFICYRCIIAKPNDLFFFIVCDFKWCVDLMKYTTCLTLRLRGTNASYKWVRNYIIEILDKCPLEMRQISLKMIPKEPMNATMRI